MAKLQRPIDLNPKMHFSQARKLAKQKKKLIDEVDMILRQIEERYTFSGTSSFIPLMDTKGISIKAVKKTTISTQHFITYQELIKKKPEQFVETIMNIAEDLETKLSKRALSMVDVNFDQPFVIEFSLEI